MDVLEKLVPLRVDEYPVAARDEVITTWGTVEVPRAEYLSADTDVTKVSVVSLDSM